LHTPQGEWRKAGLVVVYCEWYSVAGGQGLTYRRCEPVFPTGEPIAESDLASDPTVTAGATAEAVSAPISLRPSRCFRQVNRLIIIWPGTGDYCAALWQASTP